MPTSVVSIFEVEDYEAQLQRGANLLREGGVVVLPTETVYGAAGVLNEPGAIDRLKRLRAGDDAKPFTVHLADRQAAQRFVGPVGDLPRRMMRKLWPGPVGLMFDVPAKRRREVAAGLGVEESQLYQDGRITLRCPDHPVATAVIGQVGRPVVLTAAGPAANQPAQFVQDLDDKVDMVIDAGPTRFSKPSTLLHVREDGYELVRAGVFDERIIQRLLRTTILFICSGNTCRSPMAEAIARRVLAEQLSVAPQELEAKGISIISAGTFAMPGARATPQAVEAVRALGADLSQHRSRTLSVEMIHQADIILAMGRSHAQAVRALVPSAAEKVVMLDPEKDIEDPIGGDVALYRELAGKMQALIETRLKEFVGPEAAGR